MKYLVRSLKYLLMFCVLYGLLVWLSSLVKDSPLTLTETLAANFHTRRGWLLIAVVILVSAFYPRFGFTRKRLAGNIVTNREQILEAFEAEGFKPEQENGKELVFRGATVFKRLMHLYEDEIRVTQEGDFLVIDGIRKAVTRVDYRLQTYLDRNDHV